MTERILSKLLREHLQKTGMSEREFGRKVGISATTVGRILKGESVETDTLINVCSELGVSPSYILDAQLPNSTFLGEKIAAVLETNPALAGVFGEAIDRFVAGEIGSEVLTDLASYAAFRLGLPERAENERNTPGTHEETRRDSSEETGSIAA